MVLQVALLDIGQLTDFGQGDTDSLVRAGAGSWIDQMGPR
jgi:hypothetical protein